MSAGRNYDSALSRDGFRPAPVAQSPDFESFKQQESTFVLLNLFVLAVLLLIHTLFASYWGEPSKSLIAILAVALFAEGAELLWLNTRTRPAGSNAIRCLRWSSICFNIVLALALAMVTSRPETQYFILLVIPVLVAAFRLALIPTIGIIAAVDLINFFWVWNYARRLPEAPMGEYFEAMTVSLIYAIAGILVWVLVNNLRQKEIRLSRSLNDLAEAKEHALREEKLAAIGRLASAIAHEIRNPVGAIVSALSTATRMQLGVQERDEMFQIASKEAGRLERLTSDFLSYARPRGPQKTSGSIDDLLGYVAEVCRPRAAEMRVTLRYEDHTRLMAKMDVNQMQQALVNLVLNAMEASASGGHVDLRATGENTGLIQIDVIDDGALIPAETVAHIFEPFFTTKPAGTGLGLAIARNIAIAHGGELSLTENQDGRVRFSLSLPATATPEEPAEVKWAES